MTTTNETRREVMKTAWGLFRDAKRWGEARTFGDCLGGAWRFVKKMTAYAAKFARKARRAGGRVQFAPLVRSSAVDRSFAGQAYAGAKGYRAAYTTARLGY